MGTAPAAARRSWTATASSGPTPRASSASFEARRPGRAWLDVARDDRLAFAHAFAAAGRLRAERQGGPFPGLWSAHGLVLSFVCSSKNKNALWNRLRRHGHRA